MTDTEASWPTHVGREGGGGGPAAAWPTATPPASGRLGGGVLRTNMDRHADPPSRARTSPTAHTDKISVEQQSRPHLTSGAGEPSASSSSMIGLPYAIPTLSTPPTPPRLVSQRSMGSGTNNNSSARPRTPRTTPRSNGNNNFNVVIRVRPPLPRELQPLYPGGGPTYLNVCHLSPEDPSSITLCDAVETADGRSAVYARQTFTFDRVFGEDTDQETLYEGCARAAVLSVLKGYNGTLMAYGQTGTGKTYTMEGFTNERERGIIPRAVEDIFYFIDATRRAEREEGEVEVEVGGGPSGGPRRRGRKRSETTFLIRASYMQIYNEVLSDLLAAENPPNRIASQRPSVGAFCPPPSASMYKPRPLVIRHTPQDGVYIEGLSQWRVETEDDVYALIERGTALRATSATRMSELSSRSHAIFTLVVEATTTTTTTVDGGIPTSTAAHRVGKLNIVDLAGSEKVRHTGVSGQRLEETKKINKSLHELGNVISALARQQQQQQQQQQGNRSRVGGSTPRGSGGGGLPMGTHHIPFRNSALTSVLRDSLGGNCITTLIACLSPSLDAYAESLSTLSFANRAKNITNHAVANIGFSQAMTMVNTGAGRPGFGDTPLDPSQLANGEVWSKSAALALQQAADDAEQAVLVMDRRRRKAEEEKEALHRALQQRTKEREIEREKREALQAQLAKLQQHGRLSHGAADGDGFSMADRVVPGGGTDTAADTGDRGDDEDGDGDGGLRASDRYQVERYKQLLLKQRDIMLSLTTRLNERDEIILHLEDELDSYGQRIEDLETVLANAGAAAAATSSISGTHNDRACPEALTPPVAEQQERNGAHPGGGEMTVGGGSERAITSLTPEWKELLERRSAALAAARSAAVVFPLQRRVSALLLERQHLRLRCEGLLSALLHHAANISHVSGGSSLGGAAAAAVEEESVSSGSGGGGGVEGDTSPASSAHRQRQRCSTGTPGRGSGLSGSQLLRQTVEQLEEVLQSNLKSFEQALEREHQERWRLSKRTEQLQRRVELALPSSASAAGTPTSQSASKSNFGTTPSLSGAGLVVGVELGDLAKELEQVESEILTAVRHHEEAVLEEEQARLEQAVMTEMSGGGDHPEEDPLVAAQRQWQEIFEQQYAQITQLQAALEEKVGRDSSGDPKSPYGSKILPTTSPALFPSSSSPSPSSSSTAPPAESVPVSLIEPLTRKLEAYERDRHALAVILERKILRRVEAALQSSGKPDEEEQEEVTGRDTAAAMEAIHGELEGLRRVLCSTISALQEEEDEEDEDEAEEEEVESK